MLLPPLVGAAALVAAGLAHSLLGERHVVRPLLAGPLPSFMGSRTAMRGAIRTSWHLVSVPWFGIGGVLAYAAARGPGSVDAATLAILAATLVVSAAMILVVSRGRHPGWILLGAGAAGAWWTTISP